MNPPRRGTKRYTSILDSGCNGYTIWTPWGFEFECGHGYDWICEYCPILVEHEYEMVNSTECGRTSTEFTL